MTLVPNCAAVVGENERVDLLVSVKEMSLGSEDVPDRNALVVTV